MSEESLEVRKRLEEEKERKGKGKKVVVESESEEESEDEEEEDVTMGDGNKMKRKGKGKVGNLIPTGAVNGDDQEDEEENSNSNNDNDDEEEEEEESTSNPPTSYIPRILLTTSPHPTNRTHLFLRDLLSIFPGGEIRKRPRGRGYELGRIARWAAKEERGYDVLMVVNEDHKTPSELQGEEGMEGGLLSEGLMGISLLLLLFSFFVFLAFFSPAMSWGVRCDYDHQFTSWSNCLFQIDLCSTWERDSWTC